MQVDLFEGVVNPVGAVFLDTAVWTGAAVPESYDPMRTGCIATDGPPPYEGPTGGWFETTQLDYGMATFTSSGVALEMPPMVDGSSLIADGSLPVTFGADSFGLSVIGGTDIEAFSLDFTQPQGIVLDPFPPLVAGEDWTVTWTGSATADPSAHFAVGNIVCAIEQPSNITIPGALTAELEPGATVEGAVTRVNAPLEIVLDSGVGIEASSMRLDRFMVPVVSAP
jgi:hypothetical protein